MKALLLEDVRKMAVRQVPDPPVAPRHVLVRVRAVGVCGTDLHLYQGRGNYHRDRQGRLIPLRVEPQVLGHEFSGEVLDTGSEVKDLKPGDRVLCDPGRNCVSEGRSLLCPYCASGHSYQCERFEEHGITGLAGALADFVAIPAVNCIALPDDTSYEEAALVEPLGCVLHSSTTMERAAARYRFSAAGGSRPDDISVRNVLICGAGPAGLLFLQYLRNVRGFEGLILVADRRESSLRWARELGGTAVNVTEQNLAEVVRERTAGEGIHYLIECSGSAEVLSQIPVVLRRQGTVLLYGIGHGGQDIGLLDPILFLEPTLVAAMGASGGFDPDGRPQTFRRALELVRSGKVSARPFVSHRYGSLEDTLRAFTADSGREDYIKGVASLS